MARFRGAALNWSIAILAMGLPASGASADEWYNYYQIVCAPELNYFHLQSIAVDNADPRVLDDGDKLRQKGIFPLSDLDASSTHECILGDTAISFGGVHRNYNAIEDEASFWLAVNGKVVYQTDGLFFADDGLRKSTSITADTLQVEVCRAGTHPRGDLNKPRATEQTCTTVSLMPLPL